MKFLVFFPILFLTDDAFGLKCWHCTSEKSDAYWKHCRDTVNQSQMNELEIGYVSCDKPPQYVKNEAIPRCKIELELVFAQPIYKRSCSWDVLQAGKSCEIPAFVPDFVTPIECNTCSEDGCNENFLTSYGNEDSEPNDRNTGQFIVSSPMFVILVFLLLLM